MTREQKRIRIAEACGWTEIRHCGHGIRGRYFPRCMAYIQAACKSVASDGSLSKSQ